MTSDSPTLDELNAIMNLERQEAFDDAGGFSELSDHDLETPEEKLMKIIDKPLPGIPKEKQDLFKRSQAARKKSSRSRYSYVASGGGTVTANAGRFQFEDPLNPEKEEWRKTIVRSRSKEGTEPPVQLTNMRRVASASSSASNNKLPPSAGSRRSGNKKRLSSRSLNVDGIETVSLASNDTRTSGERQGRRQGKNSSHSRGSVAQSPRGPSGNVSISSANDSVQTEATTDDVASKKDESSFSSNDRLDVPHQEEKSPPPTRVRRASRTQPKDGEGPRGRPAMRARRRGSRDAQTMRSNSHDAEGNRRRASSRDAQGNQRAASRDAAGNRRSGRRGTRPSTNPASFEQAWAQEADIDGEGQGESLADAGDNDTSFSSAIERSMTSDSANKKRTKREKIFELQAKCDRYKKEWIEASQEKKKVRKELQTVQVSIVSLNMQIDTQKAETEILQKQLTGTVQKLMEVQNAQEKERAKADEVAKEFEQSKLDNTKATSEIRELRTKIEELEDSLSEKDKQIASLNHDVFESKKLIEELKLDLNHADDEGILERELKKLEQELEAYKVAAEKDDKEGGEDNLRQAQSDIEKRLHDEKERRLNEKQQKLEAKIKEFEEQKEKAQREQEERDKEIANLRMADSEKQRNRDEQRREMDSELNNRLKELEDNNTVLQGRLKSEQLESTIKLKQKDDTIEQLTKSLAEMKKSLAQRDADPEGLVALQQQVESAKAESMTVQEDLAEAQRMNGMLQEEIDDLQATSLELRGELETLENEKKQFSTEMNKVKAKSDEWQKKSSEWTDKAFRFKEKAEYWEKVCREIDPYYKQGGGQAPPAKNEDPQAMMLQAAVQKKRSTAVANNPGRWNQWGLFNKPSDGQAESQAKIQELQEKNATQDKLINKLRSEIVRLQSSHKEESYNKQQQIIQVQREMEAVEVHNTNLVKQLELARKLEHFAAQDLTTTL